MSLAPPVNVSMSTACYHHCLVWITWTTTNFYHGKAAGVDRTGVQGVPVMLTHSHGRRSTGHAVVCEEIL